MIFTECGPVDGSVLRGLQSRDFATNRFTDGLRFRGGCVLVTRPHETAKAVAFAARHNMHVKMRHALANEVVNGDERYFSCSRRFARQ